MKVQHTHIDEARIGSMTLNCNIVPPCGRFASIAGGRAFLFAVRIAVPAPCADTFAENAFHRYLAKVFS
jgi:hypothetical protein